MTDLFILPVPASMTRAATVKKARAALGRDFAVDVISQPGNAPIVVVASKYRLNGGWMETRPEEARAKKLLAAVGL